MTPLIFHQVKGQDADIKLSFWELGKKLPREGVFAILCKGQVVSIYKQKSSPPSIASEKKKSGKILKEIHKSITQERHFSAMKH